MNETKSFVEILKQKLIYGSSRSIHLNAIPGRALTKLPLTDLIYVDKNIPAEFINILTSKDKYSLKFAIDLAPKDEAILKKLAQIGKRLNAIKYDHEDYLKEHGIETFGFGFPIILRKNIKDEKKVIVAPLFIFSLDIKQTFDKAREWVIKKMPDCEIRLNELLYSYFENEEHIKLPDIKDEILEEGFKNINEIIDYCQNLLTILENKNVTFTNNNFEELPDKIDATSPNFINNTIIWNGVFGLYKSQKHSQIKEMELLISDFDKISGTGIGQVAWGNLHSPMPTDPSQNGVLRSLNVNNNIVIQGPPGTGKANL